MLKANKPDQLVQSLDRAINIIEKLVENNQGMGVTELSNSLGLHKSTVYRLLATLNYRGYVEQDAHSNYKVGLKLFEIGSAVLNNIDLRTQVKPYLKKLRDETRETVHLGILDGHEIIYIDKEETSETIRMYSKLGRRISAPCTSLGKVILAYSDPELVNEIIEAEGLPSYTEHTITDKNKFRKHLEKIRVRGFAVDNEEQEEGIRCIGGPIFNYTEDVIASFSISGPTTRITEERINDLAQLIKTYTKKISAAFGYSLS